MKTCYLECCKPKTNCTLQSLGYPQLGTQLGTHSVVAHCENSDGELTNLMNLY